MTCQPLLFTAECAPPAHTVPTSTGPAEPEFVPATLPVTGGVDAVDIAGPEGLAGFASTVATSTVIGLTVIVLTLCVVAVAAWWPLDPYRLRNFAIGSLILPVCSIVAGKAVHTPLTLLWSGARALTGGDVSGLAAMLALTGPLALWAATLWWAKLLANNAVGPVAHGRDERATPKAHARMERIKDRMTVRRSRAAARAAKSGAPYSRGEAIVLGVASQHVRATSPGVWQMLTTRYQQWLSVAVADAKRHLGIIAGTGAGKTTLLERYLVAVLSAEWTAWQRWKAVPGMRNRHARPLIVMIACKGGADDRALGKTIRADCLALGLAEERIAVIPDGDSLNIWNMPPRDLRGVLGDLMGGGESTTSDGIHFDEIRKRIVSLVVDAPIGPPRSSAQFLERLDAQTLVDAWDNAPDVVRQVCAFQEEKVPQLDDALIKMSNLFALLQDDHGHNVFDGGKNLDDLDMLYVTTPGMDPDAGRAQVAAIIRMVMQRAGAADAAERRSVWLIIDELSAVATRSGAIGLENVAERGRSQKVALAFAVQSQEGIARDQWGVDRLLKACAGGLLLGYSENAAGVCKHFGTRAGGNTLLVDPARIARMGTGEIVHVRAGNARYGQVVPVDRAALSPLPGTQPARASTPTIVSDSDPGSVPVA